MPIKERNDDQNINRVRTKMSDGCSSQKHIKPKLTGILTEKFNSLLKNNLKDCFNHSYDHLYANSSKPYKKINNASVNTLKSNGQSCESEVRFLEEWLLLHLDLIQQQNDEIVSKERTIYMLQQENEMLREHINCLQRGIAYSPPNTIKTHFMCSDMTQDAAHIEDDKSLICGPQKTIMNNCIKTYGSLNDLMSSYNDSIINRSRLQVSCDIDSEVATNVNLNSNNTDTKSLCMLRESHNSIMKRNKNDIVNNGQDTLKNFDVSIRRKRLCSGSSAFSNSTSIEEPQTSSRKRKRRNTIIKDEKFVTSSEQYVTQASSELGRPSDIERNETSCANNLEVPRWRVRVYTSLYSMEGTEDLDNEVFNKRHMRLENDERRRKRWDVQRIREQRVVEKLKLRQERIAGTRANDKTKPVLSLWPIVEDIRYIEVCDELPVSAFGAPVPRLPPSEFSLPWVINSVEPKVEVVEPEETPPPVEALPVKKNKPRRRPKKRRKSSKR